MIVKDFVDLVEKMREYQRNWFTFHRIEDLRSSQRLEKAVDKAVAEFKEGQQSLF